VNGLTAGRKIDDAQPPHAERDTIFDVNSLVIRSAMPNHFAHVVNEGRVPVARRSVECEIRETCYSAHI
jgi:hypothetical protein